MSILTKPYFQARSQSLPDFDAYPTYNYLDMDFAYGQGALLYDKSAFHSHAALSGETWVVDSGVMTVDFVLATPTYAEISAAASTHLDFTTEDFSFIARVKPDLVAGASRRIFVRGVYNTDGWYIYVDTNGRLAVATQKAASPDTSYSSNGSIVINTSYTVGFSRTGTSVKLYINGVEDTATAATHDDPTTCARVARIGTLLDGTTPWDGGMWFLRIFGGISLPATAHLWYHNMLK